MRFLQTGIVGSLLMPALILLGGCASPPATYLPPISTPASIDYRIGEFVWYDLLTENPQTTREFYARIFGWRIEPVANAPGYALIYHGDRPIGGIATHENRDPQAAESIWLAALSVGNVDQAAAEARKAGGIVLEGPVDVEGRGRMALIEDPMGAALMLLHSSTGDPTKQKIGEYDWLWTDLVTPDSAPAGNFYARLAGYQIETVRTDGDHDYRMFKRDGRPKAGIVELKWEGVEANWLPYVKVRNVNDLIVRAQKMGGKLILKTGDVAVIMDPTGAAIGIQE